MSQRFRPVLSWFMAAVLAFGQAAPVAAGPVFRIDYGQVITTGNWTPPGIDDIEEPTGDLLVEVSPSVRARVGVPMNLRLTAVGAVGATAWESGGASFPDGISLDRETGTLSGTPASIGPSGKIVIRVTDSTGAMGMTRSFVVDVRPFPIINVQTNVSALAGQDFALRPSATEVFGSHSWRVDGRLPFGLALDPATGVISGQPQQEGVFSDIRLIVRDSDGAEGTSDPITITATSDRSVVNYQSRYATRVDKSFRSAQPTMVGADGSVVWSLAEGELPSGLELSEVTGVISGTPTDQGEVEGVFVRGTDTAGKSSVFGPIEFEVVGELALAVADSYYRVGQNVVIRPAVENALGSVAIRHSGGSLPSGLEWSMNAIRGKTASAGTSSGIMLDGLDAADGGRGYTDPFSITVWPTLTILNPGVPSARVDREFVMSAPTASGLLGDPTWSVNGTLPPGLAMDPETLEVRGVPTRAGSWAFTYRLTDASDGAQAESRTLRIAVLEPPAPDVLSFVGGGDIRGTVGKALQSATPTVRGDKGPLTFSVVGSLPEWAALNETTGQIFGVPPAAGTSAEFMLSVTDGEATAESSPIRFVISEPSPGVDPSNPGSPDQLEPISIGLIGPTVGVRVGRPFSLGSPEVTGGSGSFTFALSGERPAWLQSNPSTGEIYGTPANAGGSSGLSLVVTDTITGKSVSSNTFDISARAVDDNTVMTISGLAEGYFGRVGEAFVIAKPTVEESDGPVVFEWVGHAIPRWAEFDEAGGSLSGTPNASGRLEGLAIRAVDTLTGETAISAPFFLDIAAAEPLAASVDDRVSALFGEEVSIIPSARNARGELTWSTGYGSIPDWLTLDKATGRLAGTPTVLGTVPPFSLRVTDASGTSASTNQIAIEVVPTPIIDVSGLPDAYEASVNASFVSAYPTVRNATGEVTWRVSEGALPDWAELDTTTGVFAGRPAAVGYVEGIRLTATDDTGNSDTSPVFSINIGPERFRVSEIDENGLVVRKGATVRTPDRSVEGSSEDVTWDIVAGSRPPFASVDSDTGVIEGQAAAAGKWNGMVLQATQEVSGGTALADPYSVVVEDDPAARVAPSVQAPTFRRMMLAPKVTGIIGKAEWRVESGSLPEWAELDEATGVISGTPTEEGSFEGLALRVMDDADGSEGVTNQFSINVTDGTPIATMPEEIVLRAGKTVDLRPSAEQTEGTLTWRLASGALPAWASLDERTGAIKGTPTSTGTISNLQLSVTDGRGLVGRTSSFSLIVGPALSIELPSVEVRGRTQQPMVTPTPTATGGVGDVSWRAVGNLPAGLQFDETTGVASGVPATAGAYSFRLEAVDPSDGATASSATISVTVVGTPAVKSEPTYAARFGLPFEASPTASGTYGALEWSVAEGVIPAWATLSKSTGRISGTPTGEGRSSAFRLKVVDADGLSATSSPIVIDVGPRLQVEMNGTRFHGRVGRELRIPAPVIDGAAGALAWAPSDIRLPDWLRLNTTTGELVANSETPVSVEFSLAVRDTQGNGLVTPRITVSLSDRPAVTVQNVVTRVNANVSFSPVVGGAVDGYSAELVGTLPEGLSFHPGTGRIFGVPVASGSVTGLRIKVKDGQGIEGTSGTFSITVNAGIGVAAPVKDSYEIRSGNGLSVPAPAVTNAVGALAWTLEEGQLPAGTSVASASGAVSGQLRQAGSYTYRLRVTDKSDGSYAITEPVTVQVVPLVNASASTSYGHAETPFETIAPRASSIRGKATWVLESGELPYWAELDGETGVISGTPLTDGRTGWLRLRVTDDWDGASASSGLFRIEIAGPLDVVDVATSYSARYGFPFVMAAPTALNAIGTKTWKVVAGELPEWATFDSRTGQIGGIPNAVTSTEGIVLEVTDVSGISARSIVFDLGVYTQPTATIGSGQYKLRVGTPVSIRPNGGGTIGSQVWSAPSGLPEGLELDTATGRITGSPVKTEDKQVTLRMADSADGKFAEVSFAVIVAEKLELTNVKDGYAARLGGFLEMDQPIVTGNRGTMSWSISGNPPGPSFNSTTGRYAGLVSSNPARMRYVATLRGVDGYDGAAVEHQVVFDLVTFLRVRQSDVHARNGQSLPAQKPVVTGAVGELSWRLLSGELPDGVVLDEATGILSGTVEGSARSVTPLMLRATDSDGETANTSTFNIVVDGGLRMGDLSVKRALGNEPFDGTVEVSGALANISWSANGLPSGLSISGLGTNRAVGRISGTPRQGGTFTITVTATDAGDGGSVSRDIVLRIEPIPTLSRGSYNGHVGTAATIRPSLGNTDGGSVSYELSWTDASGQIYPGEPRLPAGLTFDAETGVISGTPTAVFNTGSSNFFRLQAVEVRVYEGEALEVRSNAVNFGMSITQPLPTITMESFSVVRGTSIGTRRPEVTNRLGTGSFEIEIYSGSSVTYRGSSPGSRLPDGISFNSTTGALSGTPTYDGSFRFRLILNDNRSGSTYQAASAIVTMHVAQWDMPSVYMPEVVVTRGERLIPVTPLLQNVSGSTVFVLERWSRSGGGTAQASYSTTFASEGHDSQYFPKGLSYDYNTGRIQGVPTDTFSDYAYKIRMTETRVVNGERITQVVTSNLFRVTVNDWIKPTVRMPDIVVTRGQRLDAVLPTLSDVSGSRVFVLERWSRSGGGTAQATYSTNFASEGHDSPFFPKGLSYDYNTGRIQGVPTDTFSDYAYKLRMTETRRVNGVNRTETVWSPLFRITVEDWVKPSLEMPDIVVTRGQRLDAVLPTLSDVSGSRVFVLERWSRSGGGTAQASYSTTFASEGHDSQYFPKGLSYDYSTGRIQGVPTDTFSDYAYKLRMIETRVVNGVSRSETVTSNLFRITVNDWVKPVVQMRDITVTRGQRLDAVLPTLSDVSGSRVFVLERWSRSGGGSAQATYSTNFASEGHDSPFFPKGLSYDYNTGRIQGVPTDTFSDYAYKLRMTETRRVNGVNRTETVWSPLFRITVVDWVKPTVVMPDITATKGQRLAAVLPSIEKSWGSRVFVLERWSRSGGGSAQATYSTNFASEGHNSPYFPKGLSYDYNTGRIQGVPTDTFSDYAYKLRMIETRVVNGVSRTETVWSPLFRITVR